MFKSCSARKFAESSRSAFGYDVVVADGSPAFVEIGSIVRSDSGDFVSATIRKPYIVSVGDVDHLVAFLAELRSVMEG